MSENTAAPKAPTYPKTRWNYDSECWQTKASKTSEWEIKDTKSKFIETEDFVKMWKDAASVAEIGRRLCWPKSKVKGKRTRINNDIQKSAWFIAMAKERGLPVSALVKTDQGKVYQLAELPEYTSSQAATATKQASEGFASNQKSVMAAFLGK